jgi:ethanolamine ammonia-lyase small subunit
LDGGWTPPRGKSWRRRRKSPIWSSSSPTGFPAAQTQAAALIAASLPGLAGLKIGPVVIARFGRVALGDEIGACFRAKLCALLVGERPGLSVADSLGVYLTYDPKPGRRDSERNCISNIHANGGLAIAQAAATLCWLARAALDRCETGVSLKDESPRLPLAAAAPGVENQSIR